MRAEMGCRALASEVRAQWHARTSQSLLQACFATILQLLPRNMPAGCWAGSWQAPARRVEWPRICKLVSSDG
jgi:hypothetical protein